MKDKFNRGSIYFCTLPQTASASQIVHNNNSVERGYRPVVIVSSLAGLLLSDIVMVCPLTTKEKVMSVNVPISWSTDDRKSYILCNQIMTIPKNILGLPVGNLTDAETEEMNRAILIALGIVPVVASTIRESQEAAQKAAKDREALDKLIPAAKDLVAQLTSLIQTAAPTVSEGGVRGYKRRTPEEIADFIREWDDRYNDKKAVAKAFGFSSYSTAYSFRQRHSGSALAET